MVAHALDQARLMEESEARIEDAARAGTPSEVMVARRILDDLHVYRRWEAEHVRLVRAVAAQRRREGQLTALKSASFALIHRKAMFEHLRDHKVTGRARHAVFALLHGERDYVESVLAEHSIYLRSASSLMCSRHIGTRVLLDPDFDESVLRYEQMYAEYFRTFCEGALANDEDAHASTMRSLVPYLKFELSQERQAILAHSVLAHDQRAPSIPPLRQGSARSIPAQRPGPARPITGLRPESKGVETTLYGTGSRN
jgi:hypothetical protein